MKTDTLLSVENIAVSFGGVKALGGVSLSIDEGEVVALIGPNGAGKSTILKTIFGLVPPDSGKVFVYGQHVLPKPYEIIKQGIAYVPQGRRVFKHLTVYENLEIGGYAVGSKGVIKERIAEMFQMFPVLKQKRNEKSGQLSGGQQQMLAIARGLMTAPKVLLLDEPSLGLSPKIVKEVFEHIERISTERKTAIMIVEHNLKTLATVADRTYILARGEVVAEGGPDILRDEDLLRRVFTGK